METKKIAPAAKAVIIGGSAGSLDALFQMLPLLHKDLCCAIIVVLHKKTGGDSILVDLLNDRSFLSAKEAEEKDLILPGNIYVAPADYHLLIEQDKTFSLDYSEKVNYSRPSIDISFESAAEVFKEHLAGILLSGANADGVQGMKLIQTLKGRTIAQQPQSAEVPYMPQQAIQKGFADFIMEPQEIAAFINRFV